MLIIKKLFKVLAATTLLLAFLTLSGCSGNVGIGVSVGVPIGKYGHISIGSGRRFY